MKTVKPKQKPRQKQKQKQTISININSNNKKLVKPKAHNTNNQNYVNTPIPRINYTLSQPIPQYQNFSYVENQIEQRILNKLKPNENYVNPNRILNENNLNELQTDNNLFKPQSNVLYDSLPTTNKSKSLYEVLNEDRNSDIQPYTQETQTQETQTDPITRKRDEVKIIDYSDVDYNDKAIGYYYTNKKGEEISINSQRYANIMSGKTSKPDTYTNVYARI